jgi:hypothetical protein
LLSEEKKKTTLLSEKKHRLAMDADAAMRDLSEAVKDRKLTQKDIVPRYAHLHRSYMFHGRRVACKEIREIDAAIIRRWSFVGLTRIKKRATEMVGPLKPRRALYFNRRRRDRFCFHGV